MKKTLVRTVIVIVALIVLAVLYIGYLYLDASCVSSAKPLQTMITGENPDVNAAVMVVDIQEGTTGEMSQSAGYAEQAEGLIAATNRVISLANSHAVTVVYITQATENWLINLISNNCNAKGQPGTKIDARVDIVSPHLFNKAKMDAFSNPALDEFLRGQQINRLYLVGLDAGFCVNRTAFAALKREYQVYLIEDALIAEKPEDKPKNLNTFREAGMNVITVNQFTAEIAALNASAEPVAE